MWIRCALGALAVATLAMAGCTAGHSDPSASPSSALDPVPSVGASVNVAGLTANFYGIADISGSGQQVTILMKDFYFEPTVLHGSPGQQVSFTLKNTGKSPHTLTTADQTADIEVQPGAIAEGKLTLPQSGNVSFFCRFHKEQGMAGGFNVSGPVDSAVAGPTGSPSAVGGATASPSPS